MGSQPEALRVLSTSTDLTAPHHTTAQRVPYTGLEMNSIEVISLIMVGFIAGGLGGLLGIGGSIIMIPVLTLAFGHNQHLSQAAAMIVNIFVAVPAVIQHHRAKAVRWDAVWRMLPFGIVFIVIGVELSNNINGEILQRIFGAFLIYVIYMNIIKLFNRDDESDPNRQPVKWQSCGAVGSITGFGAGLLGIGGGIITVPLLQRACRLPLRQCIATSAAIMCLTAVIGAVQKNLSLGIATLEGEAPLLASDSLKMAACFIPTAIIGGMMGAKLTHTLKLRWVRLALIVLLFWASWQMLGLPELFGKSALAFP